MSEPLPIVAASYPLLVIPQSAMSDGTLRVRCQVFAISASAPTLTDALSGILRQCVNVNPSHRWQVALDGNGWKLQLLRSDAGA